MTDDKSRRFVVGITFAAVTTALAGCSTLSSGDITRPPEVEGEEYFDFDSPKLDGNKTAIKLNDKWWWVHHDDPRLELIGDDP